MQLQTGQERRVGVARTAAAALGEQHQRHLQLIDDRQEAVLFLVAPEPLRAGEDGVVVRHHADQRRLLAKVLGVDRSQTADDAVTRRVADQVVDISTALLGGVHEAAVLLKAARVDKVCQVLTGGSTPAAWTFAIASGRASSSAALGGRGTPRGRPARLQRRRRDRRR